MAETRHGIKTDGIEMIDYDAELRRTVANAAMLWEEFCRLPLKTKNILKITDPQRGTGFESKNGIGKSADTKENFDYSPSDSGYLKPLLQTLGNPEITKFVRSVDLLADQIRPMIEEFGDLIEHHYGIPGFSELSQQSVNNTFLRFIHYPTSKKIGDTLAAPHTDHSGFTFHLYETTDGCERLSFDRKTWHQLPVTAGQAVAFAGMQTQLASDGEIKALSHRVVSNRISKAAGRYAIVCFVSLDNIPVYDRQTHGRLQEREPGFNYTMPSEEFATLFA